MSMVVKPHQAFFLAARTDHAAGFVPLFRRLPALLLSILLPPPPSPHPSWGRAAAATECASASLTHGALGRRAVLRALLRRPACVSVRAPGPNDRLSVGNRPRSPAPPTVYASSVRHALVKSPPSERTVPSQVHPAAPRRLSPTTLTPPPRHSGHVFFLSGVLRFG